MSNPASTIRRLCAAAVLVALAAGASAGCGDRGPRATPLPPGADATLVDTSTPTTSPSIEGEQPDASVGTTAKPSASTTPRSSAKAPSPADQDLDQIEADLRKLDQDLSRSSLSDEGAVE